MFLALYILLPLHYADSLVLCAVQPHEEIHPYSQANGPVNVVNGCSVLPTAVQSKWIMLI